MLRPYMVNSLQNNIQLLELSLLRLCDFWNVQFLTRELLPQLMQHLAVVHVFVQLLDNDALLSQLVVDPFDKNALQFHHHGIVDGLRVNDGALFMFA